MKKVFSVLSMLVLVCGCLQAQITVNDPSRVYDVVSELDTFYLFPTPKPSITPQYGTTHAGVLLQKYVPEEDVTVYGVAVTLKNDCAHAVYDTNTSYKAMLMRCLGQNNPSYYQMERIDSVSFNRSHPRFCWFRYHVEENEKQDQVVPCFEMYFDTPKKLNLMDAYDTFYVGRYIGSEITFLFCPEEFGGYYTSAPSGCGLMYAGMSSYADGNLSYFTTYDAYFRHYWGKFFPIVGFRCGPMQYYSSTNYGADSTVVSWRNAELGTVYNLRLVGNDGSDTTFVTPDTSYTLTDLDPSVHYNVMLRRQCHIATTNYDTTVSSTWLSYIWIYGNDVDSSGHGVVDTAGVEGIRGAEGVAFALRPNPARGAVQVSLPAEAVGGRLSLCDLQGRELEALAVTGPTAELDVSRRPAGVYLVKFVTALGVSSRRLLVE